MDAVASIFLIRSFKLCIECAVGNLSDCKRTWWLQNRNAFR